MIKLLLTGERPRMTNDTLYNLLSTIPLTKKYGAQNFFFRSATLQSVGRVSHRPTHETAAF